MKKKTFKIARYELGNILRLLDQLKRSVHEVYYLEGYSIQESNICSEYILYPIELAVKQLCQDGVSSFELMVAISSVRDRIEEETPELASKIKQTVNTNKVWSKLSKEAPYLIPIFREIRIGA